MTAGPSGPPAAHFASQKQILLEASRTSTRAVEVGRATAAVPAPTLVAVGDIACPPGSKPTTTTCRQADDGVVRRVAEAHLGARTR